MIDPLDIDGAQARDEKRKDAMTAEQDRALSDLRFVMSDARGRHFVWQLLVDAGLYRSTFATDALVMAHNEGKRDMGLRLLNRLMRQTPSDYLKAQQENTQ